MNRPRPLGLIASGRMADTALTRHAGLARQVGIVTAANLRLASRYANVLKAGRPGPVADLAKCELVVIQSPAQDLPAVVDLLLNSGITWRGRAVALLSEDLEPGVLRALHERRASVCAAALTPGPDKPVMVAEGGVHAVRAVRGWAAAAQIRCIELKAGTKQMYAAGLTAAGALITPVLEGALRSLRAAGLSVPESRRILAYVVDSSLRAHHAHGRKTWPNPASPARREAVKAQLASLALLDAKLARFQQRCMEAALELYGQPVDWLGETPAKETSVAKRLSRIHLSAPIRLESE